MVPAGQHTTRQAALARVMTDSEFFDPRTGPFVQTASSGAGEVSVPT